MDTLIEIQGVYIPIVQGVLKDTKKFRTIMENFYYAGACWHTVYTCVKVTHKKIDCTDWIIWWETHYGEGAATLVDTFEQFFNKLEQFVYGNTK